MLFLALFGIWLGFQPQPQGNLSLATQAEEQAEYYLQQIEADRQPALHLWALSTLCQNSQQPDFINTLNQITGAAEELNNLQAPFCSDRTLSEQLQDLARITGSPDLLIAALVNAPNPGERQLIYDRLANGIDLNTDGGVNYRALATKIIARDSIDTTILPADRFHFVHFLLLFNNELLFDHELLTPNYLNRMAEAWTTGPFNPNETSLGNSVHLVTLFRLLYLTDNYSRANTLYDYLISDMLFPVSENRMNIYIYLEFSMRQLGLFDRSVEISRNFTLPLAQFLQDDALRLSILLKQGYSLYRIGRVNQAHEIFQSVLAESQQDSIPVDEPELYTNLGLTFFERGEINTYFEMLLTGLNFAREQNNFDNQMRIYRNLHITSRDNQNAAGAFNYLQGAQELAQTYGTSNDLAEVYLSMGTFYRDIREDNQMASHYLLMADSLVDPEANYRTQINIYFELALLSEFEGDFDEASRMYDKILPLADSRGDLPVYLEVAIDEAEVQFKAGRPNTVHQVVDLMTPDNLSRLDFHVLVKAIALRANYMIHRGEIERAQDELKSVVDQVMDRVRNTTDLQSGFWNVRQEYLDAIQLYTDLLIDTGRPGEAVKTLDGLKTINDEDLSQNNMLKSTHLSEEELIRYNQLTNQLNYYRQMQLTAPSGLNAELQSAIDDFASEKNELDQKIIENLTNRELVFRQVQNQLGPTDVALHITELNDWYYIATITRRSVEFKKIELDENTRSLFESAIQELAMDEVDMLKLYRVGEILQVNTLPDYVDKIILIPDSYLYQLPLGAIPLERPASSHSFGSSNYMVLNYNIEVLTSLKDLIPTERPSREYEWDFVGFGISEFDHRDSNLLPLPYAEQEIKQISGNLDNLSTHINFINEESTKDAFRRTAPSAKIMHFSTHSKVSEQDPLLSTIYMSGSEPGSEEARFDDQIFAYELFDMDLASELVMLNSCESGSGSYLQGSGVVGISRALRYAGAESVALNLWSVNDMMASEFAEQFYLALDSGLSKSEAMREAKIYFIRQNNANPHNWAPYMLIGNTDPVVEPHQNTKLLLATGFMAYLVILMSVAFGVQLFRQRPLSSILVKA